jgi:hypothetical protein
MKGEVEGDDVLDVPFDKNQLGVTPYVNTALESESGKPMMGHFKADEAGVHMIRSRNTMFVPFELIPSK